MPIWRIENDCLSPTGTLKIDYEGPQPFRIYFSIRDIIKRVFNVKDYDIWEREFRWDVPRKFFIRIYVLKRLDVRSYMLIEISLQGKDTETPKEKGTLTILITGKLRTDFNLTGDFQQTLLYRSLIKLYHYIFYRNVRREYLDLCNRELLKFYEELKKVLK